MEKWKQSDQMEYCYSQLKRIEKKQNKFLAKKIPELIQKKIQPMKEKTVEKIPEKMEQTFQVAFEKGFCYLFEKGTPFVEKISGKEKRLKKFDLNQYWLNRDAEKRSLCQFEKEAAGSMLINQSVAAAEGTVLGMFGIGLPDIPIFLGVILKTVYEIGFSFGYGNETEAEQCYILSLICLASAPQEKTQDYLCRSRQIGDEEKRTSGTSREWMMEASGLLAQKLVLAKVVQGFPIVGVAGGLTNYSLISRIGTVSQLEYKRRFLKHNLECLRKKIEK